MTFAEWKLNHIKKVSLILTKLALKGTKDINEIVEYFDYDNMAKNEKDFCPLYELGTKCHDVKKLNCYFCGCPFFIESDTTPLEKNGDIRVMSVCSIGASKADIFIQDGVQQCDCTNCYIPHNAKFVKDFLENGNKPNESFLKKIREYQGK